MNGVTDVCFAVASSFCQAWHRLPELHYKKESRKCSLVLKDVYIGKRVITQSAVCHHAVVVFLTMVTISEPGHIGFRFVAKEHM